VKYLQVVVKKAAILGCFVGATLGIFRWLVP
jgi:hypothetical protein